MDGQATVKIKGAGKGSLKGRGQGNVLLFFFCLFPLFPLTLGAEPLLCRALYDFEGDGEKKLSFKKGDLLQYFGADRGGWARGRHIDDQKKGFFPLAFVETLTGGVLSLDAFETADEAEKRKKSEEARDEKNDNGNDNGTSGGDEDEKQRVQRLIGEEKLRIEREKLEAQQRTEEEERRRRDEKRQQEKGKRVAIHQKYPVDISEKQKMLEAQTSMEAMELERLAQELMAQTSAQPKMRSLEGEEENKRVGASTPERIAAQDRLESENFARQIESKVRKLSAQPSGAMSSSPEESMKSEPHSPAPTPPVVPPPLGAKVKQATLKKKGLKSPGKSPEPSPRSMVREESPVPAQRTSNTVELIFASLADKGTDLTSPEQSPLPSPRVARQARPPPPSSECPPLPDDALHRQSEAVAYATTMLPSDPLASVMSELKESKSGWRIGQRRPVPRRVAAATPSIRINSLEMRIRQLELENEQLRLAQHNCDVCGQELVCSFCVEKRKKPLPMPRESNVTMTMEVTEVHTVRKPLPIPRDSTLQPARVTMEVCTTEVQRIRAKPLPQVRESGDSTEELKTVPDAEGLDRESVWFFDSNIEDEKK